MGVWSIRPGFLALVLLSLVGSASAATSVNAQFGSAYDAHHSGLEVKADGDYCQPPRTVECWARITNSKVYNILVCQSVKASPEHWELFSQVNSGALAVYMPGYAPDHLHSKAVVTDGRWHYLAMTFDGRQVRLFVDAKLVAEEKVERKKPAGEIGRLWIGAYPPDRLNCSGLLDELRLSSGIRSIEAVPTAPFAVDDQTLGLWHFEERGRKFADESRRLAVAERVTNPGELIKDHSMVWDEKDGIDYRWQKTDMGRYFSGTIRSPGQVTPKGLAIRIGVDQDAAVMYDTQRLRMVSGWRGGFVKINPTRFGLTDMPTIEGDEQFFSPSLTGWARSGGFAGATPTPPEDDWLHYRGFYLHGDRIVLSYTVGGAGVLESPWLEKHESASVFTRSLDVDAHADPLEMLIVAAPNAADQVEIAAAGNIASLPASSGKILVGLLGEGASLAIGEHGRLTLRIAAADAKRHFKLRLVRIAPADSEAAAEWIAGGDPGEDLAALAAPTTPHWTETVVTQGTVSNAAGPYAVDTLTLPDENPYRCLMFTSGHDFFLSGDAAICTVHGDVWTVSDIGDNLDTLRWRRFASGLYQPLGLKIVDDKVYVLGRDQITRLGDRNGDGEADWYENFNNQSPTTPGHDFATCLETDRAGNFYFLHPRDGVVEVSADGQSRRVIAGGLRNPNGFGMGPHDEITASPQEGTWTAASSIIRVKEGGWYGYGGPRVSPTRPLGYDLPWCFIPRPLDNSSGGQAWITSDRLGPLEGMMVHLSYGRSMMLLAMEDRVGDVLQGTVTPLPLRFDSGIMRGRVRRQDGMLYVSGLKGWETNAARDGCFQRVRYTGAPVHLPLAVQYHEDGIAITYSCPLDKSSAEDVDNYALQVWNYRFAEAYGSPDYKVSQPGVEGRDDLDLRAATLLPDGRTVFLSVERLMPVMQIGIEFTIDAADGSGLNSGVYGTIHALHPRRFDPAEVVRAPSGRSRLAPEIEAGLQSGVVFRYRSADDPQAASDGDVCVRRLAALHFEPKEASTPWLPAGPSGVTVEGYLKVPLRGLHRFHFVGAGRAILSINGEQVIDESSADLSKAKSYPVRLAKGYNRLRIEYAPPADAAASFQLHWSGENFASEPVPPTALFCDSQSPGLAEATLLRRGRELFADRMCGRCHATPQRGGAAANEAALAHVHQMPELSKDAPGLDHAGARFQRAWLAAWIADPQAVNPQATMPRLFATESPADQQAIADLLAYLEALTSGAVTESAPADLDVVDAGETHFERLGCIACHTLDPPSEPDKLERRSLYYAGVKFTPGALEDYLRHPHARYVWSRMPDFHLTAEEADELAVFIKARGASILAGGELPAGDLTRGQKIFADRGCRQCHSDPAMPSAPLPLTSLFATSDRRGGCLAESADRRKAAPDFGLRDDDRRALAALLASDGRSLLSDTPVEASTRLVKSLRCGACHTIDNAPAMLPRIIAEDGATGLLPENVPTLTFAGEKLRAEWTGAFIAGQIADRPRPWMAARMPSFPAVAKILAAGLAAEHGVGPDNVPTAPDTALADIGLQLTQPHVGLDCRQCHGLDRLTAKQPNDSQGISFLHVAQRIRQPYYRRWILDPLRIDPGTKMPRFSPDGKQTAVKNILSGNAERQFEALWNYLETIGQH